MLKQYLDENWQTILKEEFSKDYFKKLEKTVLNEYKNNTVYPSIENIFHAFNLVKYEDIKVVIIGQDPYHGENQAMGLAFSVPKNEKLPPSLKNIYKELEDDLQIKREDGDLSDWAKEGVLLINDVLTVRKKSPKSHSKIGWEIFTEAVIKKINDLDKVIFILWGNPAIKKEKIIDKKHIIIKGPHPSPLSAYRGFFGSKPFSKTNEYLIKEGKKPIHW